MTLKEPVPVAPGTATGAKAEPPHRATAWPEARAAAARAGTAARAGREPRRLPLGQALGHTLAEPLLALTDLPSFDTSAMDGWAVAGPGPWTVRTETPVLAGHAPAAALTDGEAVRIATGAPVPPGTTAVIRTEHSRTERTERTDTEPADTELADTEPADTEPADTERPGAVAAPGPVLHALRDVVPGQDIRPRGQECRAGDELLPAGTEVTPVVLGLAAAAGYDELPVPPRPRVEVLVLGDELLTAGLPHEGLIRDALGPMLGPWLAALGAEVLATRRIGDDAEELYAAVTGSAADLVVTTGGTAAGPVDHLHRVLDKAGATLLVDGVKVRPGHPMLLAALGGHRHLVGLPGNPLAAVSGLLTLAEPLLAALAGTSASGGRAPVLDEVHGHPYDTRLVPVVRRGEQLVPLRYNGPAMLRGIAVADGMAVVPPGGARSGQELDVLDLPWPPTSGAVPAQGACFT
ncbi:molybdopterin molybdenumtransferase MoeA [Streptomyces tanashiensis]|uniref:molybdopterin molybdotransferase MoeA n=1 Tax=Streptomyces tanashiensis TaxID=67367 RepID=UPI00167A6537|nr:molybdopterin molybdotransferase MoeA [Streptomyces tanashiensis]GGS91874.1 molybdopterin molybdenumtransferase MoeA [Streptomyces tanashiensis]